MNLRNSTLNLLDIPKVTTTTYGVRSLRFCCSNLWNIVWKNGLFTTYDRKIFFSDINSKSHFNSILKRHYRNNYLDT